MGKKHIIETNQEELIKEQEKIDKAVGKEVKVKSTVSRSSGRKSLCFFFLQQYNINSYKFKGTGFSLEIGRISWI